MESVKVEICDKSNNLITSGRSVSLREDTLFIKNISTKGLYIGKPVSITVYVEKGIIIYQCRVSFLVEDSQANFVVNNNSGLIERRQNVKVPTEVSIYLNHKITANDEQILFFDPVHIIIKNISVSGMLFASNIPFDLGDSSTFMFNLGMEPVRIQFKIVRTEEKDDGTFQYGCQFEPLAVGEESDLVGYIFQQQIALRKKKFKAHDDF